MAVRNRPSHSPIRVGKLVLERAKRTRTLLGGSEVLNWYMAPKVASRWCRESGKVITTLLEGKVYRKNPKSTFQRALELSYPIAASRVHTRIWA